MFIICKPALTFSEFIDILIWLTHILILPQGMEFDPKPIENARLDCKKIRLEIQ